MIPRTTTAALVAALVCALALSSASASAAEKTDKTVLENEHVRIWFQGHKPMLKVFPADAADDEEAAAYGYHFVNLVEYNDLDGNKMPDPNEVVASLNLRKASAWNVTREEGEGNVTLTLSLLAPVKPGREVAPIEDLQLPAGERLANVSIVFRIHDGASTVSTPEGDLTVPATSIKYDLIVASWPFMNADLHRLALEIDVTGGLEIEGESATVLDNGTAVGALGWVTTAIGNTTSGQEVPVPVRVAATNASANATRLTFTYDAAGLASLVHDPTIGVTPTDEAYQPVRASSAESARSEVPATGVLVAALAGAGAALVLRRR